jgi:protease I
MARDLSGKRVAILATDGVERVELEQPRGALYGAGADTELLSIHPGEIQAQQFDLVSAGTFSVDKLVTDASPGDYDASWPSLRGDLRNAGAEPVDERVVVDGQFTTSRSPADLPAFCPAIVEQFAGSRVPS